LNYWVGVGAQVSDSINNLLKANTHTA